MLIGLCKYRVVVCPLLAGLICLFVCFLIGDVMCLHVLMGTHVLQALRKEPLTVYGDGKQTRSFQYVSDLVSSHSA